MMSLPTGICAALRCIAPAAPRRWIRERKRAIRTAYYETCPYCGANLDPGEKCDCRQEESASAGRDDCPPHPTALKNIISILARVTFSNSEEKPNKRGNDKAGKSLFYIQEVPDMSLERAISPEGSALSSFAR